RWWTDVLYDAIKEYPVSYLLTWRNAWDRPEHFYSSYKGHHSEKNFVEFYNLPTTTFLSELNKLRK
ncbi:MAG: beta-mannosidase, partial [Rikenellaceae bacterium]